MAPRWPHVLPRRRLHADRDQGRREHGSPLRQHVDAVKTRSSSPACSSWFWAPICSCRESGPWAWGPTTRVWMGGPGTQCFRAPRRVSRSVARRAGRCRLRAGLYADSVLRRDLRGQLQPQLEARSGFRRERRGRHARRPGREHVDAARFPGTPHASWSFRLATRFQEFWPRPAGEASSVT